VSAADETPAAVAETYAEQTSTLSKNFAVNA